MAKLKSALDLANERVIISNYKPKNDLDSSVDFGPEKEPDFDFVQDHKPSYGKQEIKDFKFIEEENKEIKDNKDNGIKVQGPRRYVFDSKIIEILLNTKCTSYSSIGRLGRFLSFGLSNKNIRIKLNSIKDDIEVNESTLNELRILELMGELKNYINIFVSDGNNFPDTCDILYLACSNYNKIIEDKLKKYKEVWTISKNIKNEISKYHKSVHYFPLGVDVSRYNKKTKNNKINIKRKKITFLTVFSNNFIDLIMEAFLREFDNNDNVTLLIISKPNNNNKVIEIFNSVRSKVKKQDNELPHIVVYDKNIPEKDMPGFYSMSNLFIQLSKNGNGLHLLESAATSVPIISGNWGISTEFLNKDCSLLIEKNSDYLNELCLKMKEFYINNEQNYKEKSEKLSDYIIKNYNWDRIIENIYNRILEIS